HAEEPDDRRRLVPEMRVGGGNLLDGLLRRGGRGRWMVGSGRRPERKRLVGAVDRARRGDKDMFGRSRSQTFEEVVAPDEVGVDVGPGVLEAVADAGLGCEVNDDLKALCI